MNNRFRNVILIIIPLLFLIVLGGGIYFYLTGSRTNPKIEKLTHVPCLEEDEIADYKIGRNPVGGGIAKISIKDKNNNQEKFSFPIEISDPEHLPALKGLLNKLKKMPKNQVE